jgi:hypothetical protein
MKEFQTPLSKLLLPGLRTDERAGNGLITCKNVRPVAGVLHYPGILTQPVTDPLASFDWPFPTLMEGQSGRYLGCRHYLYALSSTYTLTPLTAWFSSAERWSFADFQSYQVFHNGNLAIIKDVASGDFFFDYAFPTCKTLINFRGQLILGNTIDGDNWLRWSHINYNDFTIEVDNEAGASPIPVAGPIYRIMYLHSGPDMSGRDRGCFVIYAEGGIVISRPYAEPTVTFGFKQSNSMYGVTNFGCVGGHEDEHLFIDNRGFLHSLTTKGDEIIGYKEFMQPLIANDPVISYDRIEKQYFISTETKCYVFSKSGLAELDQIISSTWIDGTSLYISGYTPTTLTIELSSDELDFSLRSKKHLSTLGFKINSDGKCYASVEYKDLITGLYKQTPYKLLSPAGICYPSVAGVDFRILLKVTNFTHFQLDEAYASWKLIDKHAIRGIYGNSQATA